MYNQNPNRVHRVENVVLIDIYQDDVIINIDIYQHNVVSTDIDMYHPSTMIAKTILIYLVNTNITIIKQFTDQNTNPL